MTNNDPEPPPLTLEEYRAVMEHIHFMMWNQQMKGEQ